MRKVEAVEFPGVGPRVEALFVAAGLGRQFWRFLQPYTVRVKLDGVWRQVTNRAESVTDWASVPGATKAIVDDDDPRILFAACAHDALYESGGLLDDGERIDRETADEILRVGMIARGAPAWLARTVFWAVRLGGGSYWPKVPARVIEEAR